MGTLGPTFHGLQLGAQTSLHSGVKNGTEKAATLLVARRYQTFPLSLCGLSGSHVGESVAPHHDHEVVRQPPPPYQDGFRGGLVERQYFHHHPD